MLNRLKFFLVGILSIALVIGCIPSTVFAIEGAETTAETQVEDSASLGTPKEEEVQKEEPAIVPEEDAQKENTKEGAAQETTPAKDAKDVSEAKPEADVLNDEEGAEPAMASLEAEEDAAGAIAKIGDKEYDSLKAAVSAAVKGNTVELLKNVTLDETVATTASKAITIDLAGHSVKAGSAATLFKLTAGSTLKNGTLSGADVALDITGTSTSTAVTVSDCTLTGNKCAVTATSALLTFDNNTVKDNNGTNVLDFGRNVKGTSTDCTISGNTPSESVLVYAPVSSGYTYTFTNCTLADNNSGKDTVRHTSRTLKFDNSQITGNVAERTGVLRNEGAYTTFTYFQNGTVVKNNKATNTAMDKEAVGGVSSLAGTIRLNVGTVAFYNNSTENGGAVRAHDVYLAKGATLNANAASSMKDGDMNFAGYGWLNYNASSTKRNMSFVSGSAQAPAYYIVTDKDNELPRTYATIGDIDYESFDQALEAAKDGDTIKLISKCGDHTYPGYQLKGNTTITKNVTIDLAGSVITHDTTNLDADVLTVADGAKVTFINSEQGGSIAGKLHVKEGSSLTMDGNWQATRFYNQDGELNMNVTQTGSTLKFGLTINSHITIGENFTNIPASAITTEYYGTDGTYIQKMTAKDPDILVYQGPGVDYAFKQKVHVSLANGKRVLQLRDHGIYIHIAGEYVFLDGINGSDENSGLTEAEPVKTFERAAEVLGENPDLEGIDVIGTVTVSGNETWGASAKTRSGEQMVVIRDRYNKDAMVKVTGNLTLENIAISGTTYDAGGSVSSANASMIAGEQGGNITINDNTTIEGGRVSTPSGNAYANGLGGAVSLRGAKLTMNGGEICGNRGIFGGAIAVVYGSEFVMNGGTLHDNKAITGLSSHRNDPAGGGVYVGLASVFTMNGGTISDNTSAMAGGGVSLGTEGNANMVAAGAYSQASKMIMNGGTISGNTAEDCGGGIFVECGTECEMTAGYITDNAAKGLGIYNDTTGARLLGLYAGGGIYVNYSRLAGMAPGKLYVSKVEIADNTAGGSGGGIGACPTSSVHQEPEVGSVIYNNTAKSANEIYSNGSRANNAHNYLSVSETMLNGAPYNWKDDEGNSVSNWDLKKGTGTIRLNNDLTADDADVQESVAAAKVHILRNTSASAGGGIGTNGEVYIGKEPTVTTLKATKSWNDKGYENKRPEKINFNLMQDGKLVSTQSIVVDEEGNWGTAQFLRMPKFKVDAQGNETTEEINYTIEEEPVFAEGSDELKYDVDVEKDGDNFTVTNTMKQETVDLQVTKEWEDAGKEDLRPEKIIFHLTCNGEETDSQEITPDENGVWSSAIFKDLPKYKLDENGYVTDEENLYFVEEETVFAENQKAVEYSATIYETEDGFVVTNTTTPENEPPEDIVTPPDDPTPEKPPHDSDDPQDKTPTVDKTTTKKVVVKTTKTGDTRNDVGYGILAGLALAAAVTVLLRRRGKNNA